MAELYRAKIVGDQGFQKIVAIKKLLPHLTSVDTLIKAFINEAKIAAFLQHQNIVQIYDFGTMDDSYFIAMEFLTGKDLRLTTNKSKEKYLPISLETALYITAQICDGIEYAHKLRDFQGKHLGIIHRDISPPNILITYNGQVKIIDFGIAKARNQSVDTQVGVIKGKVAYMSPEQAEGKIIDHRSDIFATGILLYEMLARRRMFNGEDTLQVLSQVREARFKAPEDVIDCKYPELFDILRRALAKEPDQRYSSSAEMLADIEKLLNRLPHRPLAQNISHYMQDLFGEEIEAEELAMRRAVQAGVPEEQKDTAQSVSEPERIHKSPVLNDSVEFDSDTDKTYEVTASTEKTQLDSVTEKIDGKTESRGADKWLDQFKRRWRLFAGIAIISLFVVTGSVFLFRGLFGNDSPVVDTGKPGADRLQAGISALKENRFSAAVGIFEALLSENPSMRKGVSKHLTAALLGQASELLKSSPEEAEKLLLKAVAFNPESVEGLFQLGLIYMEREDYKKAIAQYQKVSKLNPRYPNTYYNLGYIYAKIKNYEQAEEMFQRTVALSPSFLDEALYNLALVQDLIGKQDEAIKNIEQALDVNPDNKPARKYLKQIKNRSPIK